MTDLKNFSKIKMGRDFEKLENQKTLLYLI
jgi:hypothetical protein